MNEINGIIENWVNRLAPSLEKVGEAILRQVYIHAYTQLALAIILLIVAFILWKISKKLGNDMEENFEIYIFCSVLSFISITGTIGLVFNSLMKLNNPLYYAIDLAKEMVK